MCALLQIRSAGTLIWSLSPKPAIFLRQAWCTVDQLIPKVCLRCRRPTTKRRVIWLSPPTTSNVPGLIWLRLVMRKARLQTLRRERLIACTSLTLGWLLSPSNWASWAKRLVQPMLRPKG